jgi:FdhD protein
MAKSPSARDTSTGPTTERPVPPVAQPATVHRVMREGSGVDRIEILAEEVPVALVYNGVSHAVMMASPADLEDFALGFTLSEGIAESAAEIGEIHPAVLDAGIEVQIALSGRAEWRLKDRRRNLTGRTGCGICGVDSLEQAVRPMTPIVSELQVSMEAIYQALDLLPREQHHNRAARSLHAAAFCDAGGQIALLREDIGRHNALDKLIGAMVTAKLDPAGGFAVITSRCSVEMVQKAVVARIPILVAVSAPTLMAKRLAEENNLTLVALARADGALVVCHGERIY